MSDFRAQRASIEVRHERHFGNRVLRCFHPRPASLPHMFREAVERAPSAEAVVHDAHRVTYEALDRITERVAANFRAMGVLKGDRVALLLRNRPEFIFTLLGALRCGAVAVPVNAREQAAGVGHILQDCAAKVVVCEADLVPRLPPPDAAPALARILAVDAPPDGVHGFDELVGEVAPSLPDDPGDEEDAEDAAVILYTSGTTGQPKGAMLTHLNIVHSVMLWERYMGLGDGERSILAVPGSHVTGLLAMILSMVRVAGCTIIMREFKAERFNRLAAEERATHTVMVPAMYNLCLLSDSFREVDLSAWRIGAFGGAPMPEATIERFREELPHLQLMNCYGATETTTMVTAMPPAEQASHLDSIGKTVATTDIVVMDEQGREVPAGEHGELWISGPTVVPGYWNNPDATETAFAGGFWKSADIGSIDADGFVRLHDRMKDMIIRGGYNIYSVEVENVLSYHPAVVECAAVGQPDTVLGEKIHVFVHCGEDRVSEEEIREFCAERLADYKTPDFVTFRDEPLPRNANGKLIKRTLREAVTSGTGPG